jgi:hypothetical protein
MSLPIFYMYLLSFGPGWCSWYSKSLWAGQVGFWTLVSGKDFLIYVPSQTGPVAHPASFKMSIGAVFGWCVALMSHLDLQSRLRMSTAIHLLHLCACTGLLWGDLYLFICIKSVKPYGAMPWLRMFLVGTLLTRPIADPRTVHVRFLVEEVALGQVFFYFIFSVIQFSSVSSHHCFILIYLYNNDTMYS